MTLRHIAGAWFGLGTIASCPCAASALEPAGREAERISQLFWWMTGGAAVIWLGVMALTAYASVRKTAPGSDRAAHWIVIGGAAVPTVVLAGLLVFGLSPLPELLADAPEGALRIHIHGEQWWWRVRYEAAGTQPFETANEIRIPVGEPVEFLLHSSNVVHSFWIPALGGKMDVIPGRVNRMVLHPSRTGAYRGVCAEFCGLGHARMAFEAIVLPKAEFERWLAGARSGGL